MTVTTMYDLATPDNNVKHVKMKNDVTVQGANSFAYAAYCGDIMEIERLYNYFGDEILNAKNAGGISALMWAATTGALDIAEFLLEKGADINIKDPEGFSVIERAAQRDKPEMVTFLTNWPRRAEIKAAAEAEAIRAAAQVIEQREARIASLKQKKPKIVFKTKL